MQPASSPSASSNTGETHRIRAYSSTLHFTRDELSRALSGKKLERLGRRAFVHRIAEKELVFFLGFGAVVFVNIDRSDQLVFLEQLGIEPGEQKDETEVTEEDFLIYVGDPIDEPEVSNEAIFIPAWDFDTLHVIALCMAKSSSLELLEFEVSSYLERSESMMKKYRNSWLARILKRKQLINFLADGLTLRHQLFNHLGLLEQPDSTWDRPALDQLYERLYMNLDIAERIEILEKKLELSADSSGLVAELSHAQHSELLEIIIILLIAFEIIQTLMNH